MAGPKKDRTYKSNYKNPFQAVEDAASKLGAAMGNPQAKIVRGQDKKRKRRGS